MNKDLLFQTIFKLLIGIIVVGSLLFVSAGTLKYLYGWLFIGVLFIPMFIIGVILMIKNPELLRRRLNAKEKEKEQKKVVLFSGIMFIVGFILAGLNFRFNWLLLPFEVSFICSVLFLVAYYLYALVLKENTYLSRTIKVEDNQKVVDTGFYKIVRHPMYSITIILFLLIPLVLGSIISFIIFLIYPIIIAKRIKNEEILLENELKGYKEYKKKVKYKLIPYIW